MKNKTMSAILFTVLFALQAFTLNYVLQSAAITSIPVCLFFDIAALVIFGVTAANLFAGKEFNTVKGGVLAAMYVFICLLCYNMQLTLVTSALSLLGEAMASNMVAAVVLMVLRALLLALAVWFASRPEKPAPVQETPETSAESEEVTDETK